MDVLRTGQWIQWTLAWLLVVMLLVRGVSSSAPPGGEEGEPINAAKFDEKEHDAYYKWLGVSRENFNKQTLASNYRKLARQYHPDKNKASGAQEVFLKITKAFNTLNDDSKRRLYDIHGYKAADAEGAGGEKFTADFAFNFFKMFEEMFEGGGGDDDPLFDILGGGGGGGRRRGRRGRGPTSQMDLPANLEDLYTGKKVKVAYTRTKLCTQCKGTGARNPESVVNCQKCSGRGVYIAVRQMGPFIHQSQETCDVCSGRGRIYKEKCSKCEGARVLRSEEELEVDIAPGASSGDLLRFPGQADEHPDVETGDLIIVLRTAPHSRFQRDGSHLYTTVHLTLRHALLGFDRTLPQLDGSRLSLRRTEITQSGLVVRIPGAGMPTRDGRHGDLYVEYKVVLPTHLSKDQRLQLERILPRHEHASKFDEL